MNPTKTKDRVTWTLLKTKDRATWTLQKSKDRVTWTLLKTKDRVTWTLLKTKDRLTWTLPDLGSITCKCNRLHYNYFAIFMITLHYDYINFQM